MNAQKLFLTRRRPKSHNHHEQGFIQAALLFGIALMTAVLGGFALANRTPTSQTDAETAKVNASVILKQGSDLREGVQRYSSDYGSSGVTNTMSFLSSTNAGLFNPDNKYATPQVMPSTAFVAGPGKAIVTPTTATAAGHWNFSKVIRGNGIGDATATDPMVTITGLKKDVCVRINNLLYGTPVTPNTNPPASTIATGLWDGTTTTPATPLSVAGTEGWAEGCVEGSTGDYVYFKIVQEN